MFDLLISFLIFSYIVGILECSIACFSTMYRFTHFKRWPVVLIFGCIPFMNYYIAWNFFKAYYDYATEGERQRKSIKDITSQVNHGKGI